MSEARNRRRALFKTGMMPRTAPRTIYAHEQVLSVANGMAHEIYDELMTADNELYNDWKKQCPDLTLEKCEELFCQLLIPRLLEPARAMLATMLGKKEYEHLHESIYDALCKDHVLRQGRIAPRGRQHVLVGEENETKH